MKSSALSRRYARALFELARDRGEVDAVEEGLRGFLAMMENRELKAAVLSKAVPPEAKKEVVARLTDGRPAILRSFLYLLIDKDRQDHLDGILSEFSALADEHRGVVKVEVRSAVPLTEEIERQITRRLEGQLKATVRLNLVQDPGILGGLVVKIGDRLYDGSVKGQLGRLRYLLEGVRA